ncbi:MAG: hypothetical protein HYX75_18580 [Acidobacteria bacterium]|nr:hypothetical protein [Acidobacteriota bacterium]
MRVHQMFMRYIAGALIVVGSSGSAQAATTWVRSVGVAGSAQELWGIEGAPTGGHYLVGVTTEGATGTDILAMRIDASGNALWQKRCGDAGSETPGGACVAADGGLVIAGRRDSDIWILKLDSNGNLVWQRAYGGAGSDVVTAIEPTADGGFVLSGSTDSYAGAGLSEAWVTKLDGSGAIVWSKIYGGANTDVGASILPIADGGYVMVGRTKSWGSGDFDIWVVKTDSVGNPVWQKVFGGAAEDRGNWAATTKDGGYVIGGRTDSFGAVPGLRDAILMRITSTGTVSWARAYGSPAEELANTTQTSDGGYLIYGSRDPGSTVLDGFLIKTDSLGTISWQKTVNYPETDRITAVQEVTGGYVFAGGSTHFDAPQGDGMIVRASSSGTVDAACGNLLVDASFASVACAPATVPTTATVASVFPSSLAGSAVTDIAYGVGYVCTSAPMPDLTGAWTQISKKGSKITGMFSCQNAGSSPAGGFTVKIYLSAKRTIGRSSALIATKSVPSLSAGSTVTIKARGTKGSKHKYIVAVVDAADVVSEDDEANNTVVALIP